MGRELKRVSLDFDWPLNKIWGGYINPYQSIDCPYCEHGYSKEYTALKNEWYGIPSYKNGWSKNITQGDVDVLIEAGRLTDLVKSKGDEKVTADDVNEWNDRGFGHDSSNAYICIKARLSKLGLSTECKKCEGSGQFWIDDKIKELAENWEDIEPPAGDGYQLWETTSEGSPMSPVFKTLELLCEYAEINCSTFGIKPDATKEQWFEMLNDGFVHKTVGNMVFL